MSLTVLNSCLILLATMTQYKLVDDFFVETKCRLDQLSRMIDLNALPPDLNDLPNDDIEFVQPGIFTQLNQDRGLMDDVDVNMQSESHTLEETNTTVAGPTETELRAGAVGGDRNALEEDEAGCQPMEPFVGMRFDTFQGAKDLYNDYALRMGFSVKI